ncbi:hypothetical protein XENTR_v10012083 [Xenopus tropicalis]|uniref:Lymphocyte expansion molecule n=2 Tax=Xenopus tropicalis TaxID=8364 RepID=A0A7D9NMG9_XENTR|nr:hypothetical protein XENTR_v10012083 [Xenopus tropicalis]
MAEKKFSGAPFGSQSARFDVSAVHPDSKKTGSYTQVPYCRRATSELERRLGPGTYNAEQSDFSPSVLEKNASAPAWKRAQETEKLTTMPHLLYKETYERNRLLKQNLGPGRYNIKSFLDLLEKKPSCIRGVCSTKEERFKKNEQFCTPGPGSYGKGGNPYSLLEERVSKSASSKGIMDTSPGEGHSLPSTGCELGPGTYNLKSSINETLAHVVGNRGPYDLFSASREQPILYGHFAEPKNRGPEPGAYKVKSFTEDLESHHRKKYGVFGNLAQYPKVPTERIFINRPKTMGNPGPGLYDPKPFYEPKRHSAAPFLSSAKRFEKKSCRLLFGSNNPVGVGRYDVAKHLRGKAATPLRSSFLSKTERYLSNPARDKILEERLRQKTVSATNKALLASSVHLSTT